MTDPRHAQHVPGKGRYYTRPSTGEQLISVTNVLDTMSKPAIAPWTAKVVAEHAWEILPRMIAASRDPDARDVLTRELKDRTDVIREHASDLGTRIHQLAEAHLTGKPMPDDDEAAPYVDQYLQWLQAFGVDIERDVESAEVTIINPRHGYAGTLDLLVRLPLTGIVHPGAEVQRLPDGERRLWIVDLKSSATQPANRCYETYPLQQTAYRMAPLILLDDGTEEPTPSGVVGVAVLNLRVDDHAFIPLPSTSAEQVAFLGLLAAAKWLHGPWRDTKLKPVTVTGSAKARRPRAKKVAA